MHFPKINQHGAIPPIFLLAVVGILAFAIITSIGDFRSGVLNILNELPFTKAAGDVTFTPTVVPITDPEIGNPLRGALNQFNYFNFPSGWPVVDQYERPTWKDLEPTRDNYNFGVFDSMLTRAKNAGGKGGFRIMAAFSGTGAAVPQYLIDLMPKGFYFNYPGSGNTYAPDWNDPDFIDRADKLLQALAARYNNDSRLGWVEVGFYGDWSEWHVWQFPYSPSPTGATPMTLDNKKKLVDMTVRNFPNKQIIMMTDDGETLDYAMKTYPNMGWRRDCWGYDIMDYILDKSGWPAASERWKTAPVIVESCTMKTGSGAFQLAYDDIGTYHISLASGHNMDPINNLTSSERTTLLNAYKKSGYRYVLNSLTIPGNLNPGNSFTVNTKWTNVNVAPIYTNWDVKIRLKNSSTGQVVWEQKSATNLKSILPPSQVSVDDYFTLPTNASSGNYDVLVQVTDPNAYYTSPLNLAIQGRQSDGSYKLGTVSISSSTLTPPPTVTPTPSPSPTPTRSPSPTPTASPTVTPTPTPSPTISPAPTLPIRLDSAATSSRTDSMGKNWSADSGYIGGSLANRGTITIANTSDAFIYQTERWGLTGYNLQVPSGDYSVRLHFAETNNTITAGKRIFSVNVEGTMISNLDVFAQSGGLNRAFIKTVNAKVSDGQLNIGFTSQVENPMISGIEITKLGDLNSDNSINSLDFALLLSKWGTSDPSADLNGDGTVGLVDFSILLSKWGA